MSVSFQFSRLISFTADREPAAKEMRRLHWRQYECGLDDLNGNENLVQMESNLLFQSVGT